MDLQLATQKEPSDLEERIGYYFKDRSLLIKALTHSVEPAVLNDAKKHHVVSLNNEQLEFLGDSIIGFVVSEFLLKQHPLLPEGPLTQLKAQLVSSRSLSRAASRLELGKFLRLAKTAEKTGGRDIPALQEDALEALVAAIYLDAGIQEATNFCLSQLKGQWKRIVTDQVTFKDFKSRLQEKMMSIGHPLPKYSIIKILGNNPNQKFFVQLKIGDKFLSEGQGSTKKDAEQEAARLALEVMEQEE